MATTKPTQIGKAWLQPTTGYNTYELPSGTQTVIPSAQGALAGTYTQQDSYAPDGQLTSYTDSAAGGLPAETVTTGYDSAGEANSLGGTGAYVDSLSYTNLGEPLQYTMGTSTQPVYITDSYDSQTRRLTEQKTQTGTAQATIDDLHYGYDNFGNVTSEADTPAAGPADAQCFGYDYLGRLVQAWAQGSSTCASTPSASAEGGATPYWNAYTYNTVGDLTGITATTPTGAVTTTTDGYPAAGAARPHAISTSQVTGSSGTTNSSHGYDASGHVASITATAQNEALTWNDAGQLTQTAITPSGGSAKSTNYVYDADGTLLLTADPGTTTLYLPDEELSLNTGTGTVAGTRYYSIGGAAVAARTGASTLAYLAGDSQGTDSVAIDSGTLGVNRRYYDPYGNPRGAAPSSFPVGEKGFVGGASDTATGLTNLGAREYQPGTGSFISPDPLLQPYDPQNLNAYAYSADNPSTYSDPSGAMLCDPDGKCGSVQALNNYAKAQTGDTRQSAQPAIVNSKPKGYSPAPTDPRIGNRKVCEIGRGCAPLRVFLNRPDDTDARPAPVHKTPPARPATNGRDTSSCTIQVSGLQIGLMLGGCPGEGVTIGINLSQPGDEQGNTAEEGEEGQDEGITPGEITKRLENGEEVFVTDQGEFSAEEMAQLTYQHTGEGDIVANQPDKPRPTLQQIEDAIARGKPTEIKGQNAVRYDYGNVRVILNLKTPTRSTSYYK